MIEDAHFITIIKIISNSLFMASISHEVMGPDAMNKLFEMILMIVIK